MEFSLHRQLKQRYAGEDAQTEAVLGPYRIDVRTSQGELIEVQHGSLAAIRDKIADLQEQHSVLVVKPIVKRKTIVRLDRREGKVLGRRKSPKRGQRLDIFDELVYFRRVFPHPNLTLEIPLVEMEELRFPGHGRRRRRRENDFQIQDQRLLAVEDVFRIRTARDLLHLVGVRLPKQFHTGELAESAEIPRYIAQRIAYCWRNAGAVETCGKQGNAILYRFPNRFRPNLNKVRAA